MIEIEVVRVFVSADGDGGSPLGVVRDGASLPDRVQRQDLARRLGFSETVFVDDVERGTVDIYTPSERLDFAGYPLIGAAWVLREHAVKVDVLRPPAGEARAWTEDGQTWIAGRPEWVSDKRTEQFGSAAEVDALPTPPPGEGWLYAWAWADEAAGAIRARGFPRRGDVIVEDEATGAAAMLLAGELGRDVRIRQGAGSDLVARIGEGGWVELGGRVAWDEPRLVRREP